MKDAHLLALTLLYLACAGETDELDTFETTETLGATDTDTGDGEVTSSSDSETGSSSSSGRGDAGDGDESSDTGTGDGDGDGDSSATDTATGSGDNGTSSTDSGGGDGDGDGDDGADSESGTGSTKFPGEDCDPFIDTCIDGYECTMTNQGMFQCFERSENYPEHDGLYGSRCNDALDLICKTGLICRSAAELPEGDCDHVACCAEVCAYGDSCDGGLTCEVLWWPDTLPDHMDPYGGIGYCG